MSTAESIATDAYLTLYSDHGVTPMTIPNRASAIIVLNDAAHRCDSQVNQIKKLSLIFDEIEYILPELWTLDDEMINDPDIVVRTESEHGPLRIGNVDPMFHPVGALKLPLDVFPERLKNTIEALEEVGIVKESDTFTTGPGSADSAFRLARRVLAWQEAKDPLFAEISGTTERHFHFDPVPLTFDVYNDTAGPDALDHVDEVIEKMRLYLFSPPPAIIDSTTLSNVLYESLRLNLSPVLLEPIHRLEMQRRYEMYQSGLRTLQKLRIADVLPIDFDTRFGEVALVIANGLIDSDVIEQKSIGDIIRYREACHESRRKFISEHLITASAMIEGNPWDRETRDELDKYIRGKLSVAVMEFEEKSTAIWQKLFGTLSVSTIEIARNAALGGLAGTIPHSVGIVGDVIPNVSAFHFILLAGLGSALKKSPEIAATVLEAISQHKSSKRRR